MEIFAQKSEMRAWSRQNRRQGQTIAFIPTMGYLHEGHLALVRKGQANARRSVVSIFVNPTQFGEDEDFQRYPRDTSADLNKLQNLNVDAVFMPQSDHMYEGQGGTFIEVPKLSSILQGAVRPGHFRGVATVVNKLFHIVEPDVAVFGEKDYQQLTIIRRMVEDLDLPVKILGHETVREPDGLAMSSRNVRLSSQDRKAATVLNQALDRAEHKAREGGSADELMTIIKTHLSTEPRATPQSIDIRSAQTLSELPANAKGQAVIPLSVSFADVLLIDQRVVTLR